jgi:NDP-4-keto-2,6-dideoxyhexose 3-C-methyltransferase
MESLAAVTTRDYCRACAALDPTDLPPMTPVLLLGPMYLSSFPAEAGLPPAHPKVPLTLMACPRCGLVQLRHTTPFQWMFGGQYWYRSGVNETMVAELGSVAIDGMARTQLGADDVVLDIGANDGTLLSAYPRQVTRVACEPSTSLYEHLRPHCHELHSEPFPTPSMEHWYGKVKVITACAMIYDLDAPVDFFAEVKRLLHPEGVAIVQFQDLLQMLESTAFDCICHEHLEYYSLWALANLLNAVGLMVVDVEPRPINGGSLRVTIQHRQRIAPGQLEGCGRVLRWLEREGAAGLTTEYGLVNAFKRFTWQMVAMRAQVRALVDAVIADGGVVDLLGASTKGATLIQWVGLDHRQIRYAIERSPEKWGRVYGESGVPIVSEEAARAVPADLQVCTIWQFREALLRRELDYMKAGGQILFPLPGAELVRLSSADVEDVA